MARVSIILYFCSSLVVAAPSVDAERPDWMWASTSRPEGEIVELTHGFHVMSPVRRADLRLAGECTRCELFMNGRLILALDDYGPWLDLDIAPYMRRGDDTILLRCHASEGPSAVALTLTLITDDGLRTSLRSGPDWQSRIVEPQRSSWEPARCFGAVASEYWDADRTARITPFDNYEQWRQASSRDSAPDPATFMVRPGFEIERIHSAAADEGSWVSLTFDPQGRLIVGREDRGLLRMTLADDRRSVARVETIEDSLLECRGLLFRGGTLFAQANNSRELVELEAGDKTARIVRRIRAFPGGVGHGRNDLALGPDGAIYAIFGDAVELPREGIVDLTSPFREARRGMKTTEGHLLRYDPDSAQWHLICSGLRNPFGIDFNEDGEAFTYDADAEFDMGAPWYRPTRFVHLVSGGDYGWRGRTNTWPPYDADHADNTLPSGDIGKGSPTAVKSGRGSVFPPHYRRAMFALDWAYGRILACHLLPRGAGYVCRAETFAKGRPFNVTDLEFGPDGQLYVITGGRGTHSDLYRIRWIGDDGPAVAPTPQQVARNDFSRAARQQRRRMAEWHGGQGNPRAVMDVWEWIGHPDPMLRNAALVALETQPVELWSERVFRESRPAWLVAGTLALARSGRDEFVSPILEKLLEIPLGGLSAYDRSMLLETWSRCLTRPSARSAPAFRKTVDRIESWYPDTSPITIAPAGAGRSVNHQLALLAAQLDVRDLVPKTLRWLATTDTQEERLHALFVLRNCRQGWSLESRREVFEILGELDRTAIGGEGMPSFLRRIREEMVATLSDAERESLGNLIRPGIERDPVPLQVDRPVVKAWNASDIPRLLEESRGKGDPRRGRELFRAALCIRCHRAGSSGGVVGPDLTSVASRFGRRDILLSILEPSRVVDEKYRSEQIVTTDGRVLVGRIVLGGDYRSTKLRLATDPLRPDVVVEVDKSDIQSHQPSPQSPMPSGLLDTLTPDEIRDLLAFLEHPTSDEME